MKYNGVGNITREGRARERDPRTYTCSYKNGSSAVPSSLERVFLREDLPKSCRTHTQADCIFALLRTGKTPLLLRILECALIVRAVRTKCKCETFCFVEGCNQILTIVMSSKQIHYPDLDYILQINSEYGLFFCLPQIINSGI